MGADVKKGNSLGVSRPASAGVPTTAVYQDCSKLQKLGLLDAGDGWLRKKFGEIGVIQYEDWVDIEDEVDSFLDYPRA